MFLRGVDPDRGTEFGIYRERPSGEFINELCMNLIDQREMVKPFTGSGFKGSEVQRLKRTTLNGER